MLDLRWGSLNLRPLGHKVCETVSTWDLIALGAAYVTFCPINLSAHLEILPSASGFWMISRSGYLDTTVMGCASK
jgi:hypothetical protein